MIEPRPAYSSLFAPDKLQLLSLPDPFRAITREWAWEGSNGAGVNVGVIDSGIDADHPAVAGRVCGYVTISDGPDGPIYDTVPHGDAYGHGTACAGIICSIAPDCNLYSIRVLGPSLGGRGTVFAAGVRWAIENGMQVCNLSLGTTRKDYFALLHELADQAYFRNVVLVTAANNMPIPSYPSVYASVISVASHEEHEPYLFYYNPEPPVEFGAPGIDVRVAWLGGGWATMTGNSFAAPHITGIAAKILGKHPTLNPVQLKAVLQSVASNVAPEPSERRPAGSGLSDASEARVVP